jgi:hypothetical protein
MSGLVQSSWRSPLTHTALASAFAWISEISAIRVIGMTSLGSHRNEVCDPRKLKPELFHDAASGTKIVEVDGSSSVGGEAARRTIEPPDDFPGIMLSRECDDHAAPSYIRNLCYPVESSIIVNLLQLRMSRSYNGLVFGEYLHIGTYFHHIFSISTVLRVFRG